MITQRPFHRVRHVHMVGIGGAGMSGIAEVLINLGFEVSGSDLRETEVTIRLSKLGAKITIGHFEENIRGADVVVFSSAVRPENVEVRSARDQWIPTIPRSEMLAELMRLKVGVAVSGTHGKTTTTSMIGTVLHETGRNPTLIVGGKVRALGSGVKMGSGDLLVVEADEFDRSFLKLTPTIAVITTIEAEHLDTYTDLEGIKDAFVEFANKVPFYGAVIVYGDDENIQAILPRIKRPVIRYGAGTNCDYRAANVRHEGGSACFDAVYPGGRTVPITLQVPGVHNALNSLAAIVVCSELDVEPESVQTALKTFTGVHRRFEVKGETNGVLVIDDYAHHPTEVRSTLRTARECWPQRRLVVLFQPHLYSRTRDFAAEFADALEIADCVLLADIYPAREKPIAGITSRLISDKIRAHGSKSVVEVGDTNMAAEVKRALKTGDVLVVMGAGTITQIADELVQNC